MMDKERTNLQNGAMGNTIKMLVYVTFIPCQCSKLSDSTCILRVTFGYLRLIFIFDLQCLLVTLFQVAKLFSFLLYFVIHFFKCYPRRFQIIAINYG